MYNIWIALTALVGAESVLDLIRERGLREMSKMFIPISNRLAVFSFELPLRVSPAF